MTKDHYKNELIKDLRESARLTQEELASRVNTHWGTISRVESGRSCSFLLLCELANVFGVKWQALMRIEETEEENLSAVA